jgi:hypothetical protein
MHMAVQHVEGAIVLNELKKPLRVQEWIPGVGTSQDSRSQGENFIVVRSGLIGVYQKVGHKATPVHVPQHVHEPGFHTAAIHRSENMKYASGFHEVLVLLSVSL